MSDHAPFTLDDLARIEELAEHASDGPWEVGYDTDDGHFVFATDGDVAQQRNVVRELDRELVLGGLGDSSSSGWLDALNMRGYVIARRAGADQ